MPYDVVAAGIDDTLMLMSERVGIAFLEHHDYWLRDEEFVNEVFALSKVDHRWGIQLDHEIAADFLRGVSAFTEDWAVLGLGLSLSGVEGSLTIGEAVQFLSPELLAVFQSSIRSIAEDAFGPQHSF